MRGSDQHYMGKGVAGRWRINIYGKIKKKKGSLKGVRRGRDEGTTGGVKVGKKYGTGGER